MGIRKVSYNRNPSGKSPLDKHPLGVCFFLRENEKLLPFHIEKKEFFIKYMLKLLD